MSNRDHQEPVVVTFPLRGEWYAPNTPGHRIPSHGTDQLGQRYASDFVKAEDVDLATGWLFALKYWLGFGIDLKQSKGMHAPIFSPISGPRRAFPAALQPTSAKWAAGGRACRMLSQVTKSAFVACEGAAALHFDSHTRTNTVNSWPVHHFR